MPLREWELRFSLGNLERRTLCSFPRVNAATTQSSDHFGGRGMVREWMAPFLERVTSVITSAGCAAQRPCDATVVETSRARTVGNVKRETAVVTRYSCGWVEFFEGYEPRCGKRVACPSFEGERRWDRGNTANPRTGCRLQYVCELGECKAVEVVRDHVGGGCGRLGGRLSRVVATPLGPREPSDAGGGVAQISWEEAWRQVSAVWSRS